MDGWKRNEVPGDWRRLHNEYLHGMYFSPNVIWLFKSRKQMGESCGTYGGEESCVWVLGEETWGERQLRRPRCR
jgi:hypothetical protein